MAGNLIGELFGLEAGCWAHVWNLDGDKKYVGSFEIKEVGFTTISFEGKGEFTFQAEEDNDHWLHSKGSKYVMVFGGSPEEDAHDSLIGEQAQSGYELPHWYSPLAAGAE